MSQRKPYNPNSKYGRKKIREEYYYNRQNMSQDERFESDRDSTIITVVVIAVIFILIFLILGKGAAFNWLTH